jgi:hypothetical protein
VLVVRTTDDEPGYATDLNYARIIFNGSSDATRTLELKPLGEGQSYYIGSAPSSFGEGNLRGGLTGRNAVLSNSTGITDFGIYLYDIEESYQPPNLVAQISGISLADFARLSGSAESGSLSIVTIKTIDDDGTEITNTLDAGFTADGTELSSPATNITYLNSDVSKGSDSFVVQDTSKLTIGDVINEYTYGFASGTTITDINNGTVTVSQGATSDIYSGYRIYFDHISGTTTNHLGSSVQYYTPNNVNSQEKHAINFLGTGAFFELIHDEGIVRLPRETV